MNKSKLFDSGFSDWTPSQLPDLTGKTFLITGGNSGVGFESAKILVNANANIILAGRNSAKVQQAKNEIMRIGSGQVDTLIIDLADMAAVRLAAEKMNTNYSKLDGLINCAGVMQTPKSKTVDGFELQMASNHLGHFLLTGLLFDLLEKASGRIVNVSSVMHLNGEMYFNDLMLENDYNPTKAYKQSKLANLLFTFELNRRLKAAGSKVTTVASHPGVANTQLTTTGPTGVLKLLYKITKPLFAQPAYNGAISTVLAAAGTEAKPGAYYGPQSMGESKGKVSDAMVASQALDVEHGAKLWTMSEKLVGLSW
ncbi:MAG: short-chain dehydrogenase [Moritella sp.]|uniref:oxidoreductase n=1 Tax=Moritella sp. TaxID=78556 RepID=UPI000C0D64FC|nr:oxidoreductase [Moritella sp.]MBL1417587.1 SDR family NAD(P)-dependent oxidoreductase [Moritella sp.]PHR90254.1 MAG: short-chain dehydrogenase [Moritella sp.]